jgi:hypothetical protein
MGDNTLQHRPLRVGVSSARDKRALVPLDVGQRAEAVVFQLDNRIGMIERVGDAVKVLAVERRANARTDESR